MAYADFTLEEAVGRLGLTQAVRSLFPDVPPVPPPGWLTELLAIGGPLARTNEKSRSEAIVYPVLSACRLPNPNEVAVYSGYTLNVDRAAGLVGECDFLIAASPPINSSAARSQQSSRRSGGTSNSGWASASPRWSGQPGSMPAPDSPAGRCTGASPLARSGSSCGWTTLL